MHLFIGVLGITISVFNSSSSLCVNGCALIQDLSPSVCHLSVTSEAKFRFNLPCKTAVWLQEIWIIKRMTRRLLLWAQQGIQTPQTKNMRLDYEEWIRMISWPRQAGLFFYFIFFFFWATGKCLWRVEKYSKRKRADVGASNLKL